MQRILHIVGGMNRAGAETMLMNLYRNMDRTKVQFDFVVFTDTEGDYYTEIRQLGGHVFPILAANPIKRMLALKRFLLNHSEYSIVHCHTLFSNAFHLIAAKLAGVKIRIAHSHNTSDNSKGKLVSALYHSASKFTMQRYATHFIGCGEAAATFLFPSQRNVLLLPNAIDVDYFSRIGIEEKNYLINSYKLTGDCLKLVHVGRLQDVKNHFFSIQIAKALKVRGIDFKMFFIGQGELRSQIEEKIKENDLCNEIIMTGVRDDVPKLMAGADMMLMPSFFEGFPVVLVEAQAVGLPTLVSDTVSKEVDLSVGLIEFESIMVHENVWVERLLNFKRSNKILGNERSEKLKDSGFDIKRSSEILFNYYSAISSNDRI